MTGKRERQAAIREIIGREEVGSQESLRRLLRQRGWDVTQSTLSRDLREMRIARLAGEDGSRYVVSEAATGGRRDPDRPVLEDLLPPLFLSVDGVGELVVLRTRPGGAHTIGQVIDDERLPDVIGTLAGDDTLLLICRSGSARERTVRRLRTIAEA